MLKQRGLCELSEIAETFSIVYVTVSRFLFIWLYENAGAVDELTRSYITPKRGEFSSERRLFSKMTFTTYHSSCYRIESRTSKNSHELRASIEKDYVKEKDYSV